MEANRIKLRNVMKMDTHDFFEIFNQVELCQMIGWAPNQSFEEVECVIEEWITNPNIYALELIATGKVIGYLAVHEDSEEQRDDTRELAFALNKKYHRLGIMSEILPLILEQLFTNEIKYVWACCIQTNVSSRYLIEKLGFSFIQEGTYYSEGLGQEVPSFEYRMSFDDWTKLNDYNNKNILLHT